MIEDVSEQFVSRFGINIVLFGLRILVVFVMKCILYIMMILVSVSVVCCAKVSELLERLVIL